VTSSDGGSTDQASDLARLLFSNQNRDATLQAIAEMAQQNLPGCIAASVTVSDDRKMHTAVSSADLALFVDERQYEARRGPCLDAIRDRGAVKVDDYAVDERWPEVTGRAHEAGVNSSLSLPLMAGDNGIGALNLYGGVVRAFDGYEERAGAFADTAAVTVANALAFHRAAELSTQLAEGLESRDVIGQAKGMLMAREQIGADRAFDRLKEMSQHQNRKLRDVAADLVAEANAASIEP
jgi:GAF domain-containing protein